jgi:hypothetical protein
MEDFFGNSLGGLFPLVCSRDAEPLQPGHSSSGNKPEASKPGPSECPKRSHTQVPNQKAPNQPSSSFDVSTPVLTLGSSPSTASDDGREPHAQTISPVCSTSPEIKYEPSSKPPAVSQSACAAAPAASASSSAPKPAAAAVRQRGSPSGRGRAQGTWSAAENTVFFRMLGAHGRAFDVLHDALKDGKSREQVPSVHPSTHPLLLTRVPSLPQAGYIPSSLAPRLAHHGSNSRGGGKPAHPQRSAPAPYSSARPPPARACGHRCGINRHGHPVAARRDATRPAAPPRGAAPPKILLARRAGGGPPTRSSSEPRGVPAGAA